MHPYASYVYSILPNPKHLIEAIGFHGKVKGPSLDRVGPSLEQGNTEEVITFGELFGCVPGP